MLVIHTLGEGRGEGLVTMQKITIIEFLEALFGEPLGPGRLVLWTRTIRARNCLAHWPHNLDGAARYAHRYCTSRDVWVCVTLQDAAKALEITRERRKGAREHHGRGSDASAILLPFVWVELPVASPGESRNDLPPDRTAALGLLEAVPVPPSIIVDTGTGFEAYWRLDEPLVLDSPEARQAARYLVARVHTAVRRAAAELGWTLDQNNSLAYMLRLPGTLNHAVSPATTVTVEHLSLELLNRSPQIGACAWGYAPEDFDGLPEPEGGDEALLRDPGTGHGYAAPAAFHPVYSGCAFLQYCYRERTGLPAKLWRAALRMVVRCRHGEADGRRLGHRYSRDHPGNTPEATDCEIDRALAAGPLTCDGVAALGPEASACCVACPSRGSIRQPLELAERPWAAPAIRPNRAMLDPADILITHLEHEVNDLALAALAAREPNLLQHDGRLVEVIGPGSPPRVQPLAEARLRELLSRHCAFSKTVRGSRVEPAHPPRWTVQALLSRGVWPQLPDLEEAAAPVAASSAITPSAIAPKENPETKDTNPLRRLLRI